MTRQISLLIWLALFVCGCAAHIVPPSAPVQPATVCVLKYNRFHSSLVLPENSGAVEYAYGEWKWFALQKNRSYRILPVLLTPSQGTLGRRYLPFEPGLAAKKTGAPIVLSFRVSSEDALRLERKLNARFAAEASTQIYNPDYQMCFVKDRARYWGFHNCNNELASWLSELGCKIEGPAMWGRFRLETASQTESAGVK